MAAIGLYIFGTSILWGQGDRASGSRQDAHVRDVRRPDPPASPEPSGATDPLTMRTCELYGHSRARRGPGEHLRPRRRSPLPASTPAFTARHSPRPRAAAIRTARTARGTPPARFQAPIRPDQWHNRLEIIGHPQEAPCAGLLRRAARLGFQPAFWRPSRQSCH